MHHPDLIEKDIRDLIRNETIAAAEHNRLICVRHGMLWYRLVPGTAATVEIVAIVVTEPNQGIGSSLLAYLYEAVPHATRVIAQVKADSPASGWFWMQGFRHLSEDAGAGGMITFRKKLTERETDD